MCITNESFDKIPRAFCTLILLPYNYIPSSKNNTRESNCAQLSISHTMPETQPKPFSDLPQLKRLVTTHNAEGKAVLHPTSGEAKWEPFGEDKMAFSMIYSTSKFPASLTNDADIVAHQEIETKGVGLVNPGGTIIRCVDMAPGYKCPMHRTKSLDYGIVLEGEVEMLLDSGESAIMKRGDVAVQRATQHLWVNRSETQWARMMFVLQDCEAPVVGGKALEEDLAGVGYIPPSGN
jgi:hypothetical protein